MKQLLFLLSALLILASCGTSKMTSTQTPNKNYLEVVGSLNNSTDTIKVDKYAMYPDGIKGILKHINKNLSYPESAEKNRIEGVVIIKFVVETDGTIKQTEIVKSVDQYLDAEAVRVVRALKTWIPGYKNGKPVRVFYKIPITFTLR